MTGCCAVSKQANVHGALGQVNIKVQRKLLLVTTFILSFTHLTSFIGLYFHLIRHVILQFYSLNNKSFKSLEASIIEKFPALC